MLLDQGWGVKDRKPNARGLVLSGDQELIDRSS